VAGLQIGFLATVLIAVNNLRDAPQDALVGKKTLAVRFGVNFARFEIAFLVIAPYCLGIAYYLKPHFSAAILPVIAVPIARRVLKGVFTNAPGPIYNQFLAMAALLHLGFGILLAVGFWLRN
ncbi:MAG TPA: prenyltransferase, partial [Bdellovibrionales bacterium]|nr:prenyltransferase [Bdellovibrionales bacterium]